MLVGSSPSIACILNLTKSLIVNSVPWILTLSPIVVDVFGTLNKGVKLIWSAALTVLVTGLDPLTATRYLASPNDPTLFSRAT